MQLKYGLLIQGEYPLLDTAISDQKDQLVFHSFKIHTVKCVLGGIPLYNLLYSIEWEVINRKEVFIWDAEQDVVRSPALYWQIRLQICLDEQLRRKTSL